MGAVLKLVVNSDEPEFGDGDGGDGGDICCGECEHDKFVLETTELGSDIIAVCCERCGTELDGYLVLEEEE